MSIHFTADSLPGPAWHGPPATGMDFGAELTVLGYLALGTFAVLAVGLVIFAIRTRRRGGGGGPPEDVPVDVTPPPPPVRAATQLSPHQTRVPLRGPRPGTGFRNSSVSVRTTTGHGAPSTVPVGVVGSRR